MKTESPHNLIESKVRLVMHDKVIIGKLLRDYDSTYYVETGEGKTYDQHYFHPLHIDGIWEDCIFLK
jgi:hypothetical protein